MDGRVVHAREGRRDEYRPLVSRLCGSSAAGEVLAGLLEQHPFRHCYIADLDAILGRGGHRGLIENLRGAHPDIEFWVDAGLGDTASRAAWPARLGRPVVGSESMDDAVAVTGNAILSLDFRGADFLGPRAMLDDAGLWPEDVIVMTLARVGGALGPDLERLAALRARAPGKNLYAAGGVRGGADLAALERTGAAGVLLASALHDGRLSRTDLAAYRDIPP